MAVGTAVPLALLAAYLGLAGSLSDAFDATVLYPIRGIRHADSSVGERLEIMWRAVGHYGIGGGALLVGLVGLLADSVLRVRSALGAGPGERLRAVAGDPVVAVVATPTLVFFLYSLTDLQAYPDLFPLLPGAALGLGALVAGAVTLTVPRPRLVAALVAASVVAALGWSAVDYHGDSSRGMLNAQNRTACGVQRVTPTGRDIWVLGDASVLVLTGRTNPDRFIYIGSGTASWKIKDLAGRRAEWFSDIVAARPALVMIEGVNPRVADPFGVYLRDHGYLRRFIGRSPVLIDRSVLAAPASRGVVRLRPGPDVHDEAGRPLPSDVASCGLDA